MLFGDMSYYWIAISIHAPPRGATKRDGEKKEHIVFQFTPLREGRRGDGGHFRNRQDFNSRPSARGDMGL